MAPQNLGPKKIHGWKVKVDRQLCIGAATCIALAGKTFALDDEAKAVFLDSPESDTKEMILDAARGCPTAAIIIEDESGKCIFPK
jgi:ferredoxin